MEDKPSIREEWMKVGVKPTNPGRKPGWKPPKPGWKPPKPGWKPPPKPPWKAKDGFVEQSAIANATDVVPMTFNMDLRIVAPLQNPHGAAPSPSERRRPRA